MRKLVWDKPTSIENDMAITRVGFSSERRLSP